MLPIRKGLNRVIPGAHGQMDVGGAGGCGTGKKVRFKEKRPFGSDGSGLDAGFHPLDADFRPLDAIHICQELKKFALGKKVSITFSTPLIA